jgi:p-hydroxybenzoate 3-monooxygenase
VKTQVGIVGAGPAGLMLGHLLHRAGIDSVILEDRSQDYVIERVRAGVLEQGTVDLMRESGVGDRLAREGMRHEGIYIAFNGERHRIDMAALTGGRAITIYGQHEVVKDLIAARVATGRPLLFEVADVRIDGFEEGRAPHKGVPHEAPHKGAPYIRFRHGAEEHELHCDFIAGCDGSHGICRPSIPPAHVQIFEREYPFAWLGILASAPPSSDELVYSLHDRGFALFSMRSSSVTRLYLQCAPDEEISDWSDDRIWTELLTRLRTSDGWEPNTGPILQKGITPMRSFVADPMRYGRLFLAGDAAHIVPPTGAKGLNLAMADVTRLAAALAAFYADGSEALLDEYSARGLKRTWRAQRFSWWMTSMLHKHDTGNPFDHRRQLAELEYLVSSPAAMSSLAENYVGTPFD